MIIHMTDTARRLLTQRVSTWRSGSVRKLEPEPEPEPAPLPESGSLPEDRTSEAAKQQTLRVLVIAAHPDDLEIACGGTLAKLASNGHQVRAVVMSDGHVGGDASVRGGEALRGAATLGFQEIELCHLPDTRLGDYSMDMVTAIERAIRQHQPDLLLTHSEHDQHQDHQAVHVATLRAGRFHPSILCFESPSATRAFNPSFYVDIEDQLEVKIRAVEQHQDQLGKPYMTADRISSLAFFRGAQAKRKAAEGFEPVRLLSSAIGVLA
jgi:LmbE family N-acetylglucosaminyl deacetylase